MIQHRRSLLGTALDRPEPDNVQEYWCPGRSPGVQAPLSDRLVHVGNRNGLLRFRNDSFQGLHRNCGGNNFISAGLFIADELDPVSRIDTEMSPNLYGDSYLPF